VETLLARDAESTDFLKSPALEVEARALAGHLGDGGRSEDAGSPAAAASCRAPSPPVRSTRRPWWLYALAALFLCDWLLRNYCIVLGPRRFEFALRWEGSRAVVETVSPGSVPDRAGFEPGDVLLAIDGQAIRSRSDWRVINPNLEPGRTYRIDTDRGGRSVAIAWTIDRVGLRDRWIFVLWEANGLLLLATAFLIAFSRPRDSLARLGALALATLSGSLSNWTGFPVGCAAVWRALPFAIGALLWVPTVCTYLVGPILLTFFGSFPRTLVRPRWAWAVIWLPAACLVPAQLHDAWLVVYRPAEAFGNLRPEWIFFLAVRLYGLYALLSLLALAVNYFRLTDLNDRRRLRVLFVGGAAAVLPGAFRLLIWRSTSLARIWNWLWTGPPDFVMAVLFVLLPASFAYSILRHRLLDIRLIIRQGVQYAAARGVLLSAVPIVGAGLVADLLVHGEQPLIRILEARGWMYAVVGTAAAVAHSQRRRWGEAIDRRFFRERYDARRLLREVAVESGRARSFTDAASVVVARVEAARLHQLIHRDLKPENIFLARGAATAGATVKILGFGIAKFLPGVEDRAETQDAGETDAGIVVGTPGYMSPEQLLGEEPAVSWDLWALTVTAYEMLTGALPFSGAGGDGWRRSVLAGRAVPLSEHLADPPAAWEDFFARSLAADRAKRPGSAGEFLQDLERALSTAA
jgi:hypothetical protein